MKASRELDANLAMFNINRIRHDSFDIGSYINETIESMTGSADMTGAICNINGQTFRYTRDMWKVTKMSNGRTTRYGGTTRMSTDTFKLLLSKAKPTVKTPTVNIQPPKKNPNIMDPDYEPSDKSKLLTELKNSVNNRRLFHRGAYLMLRTKLRDRAGRVEKIYHVKQVVWSIDELPVKAVVVKQLTGPNNNISALSRYDCTGLHVKYEAGLQVLSMELPWVPVTANKLLKLKSKKKSKTNKNGKP